MIYSIKGVLKSISDNYLVVRCNDIGYRLMYYGSNLSVNSTYCFYVLHISSDNKSFHIAYIDEDEMLFYKGLLDITGIGIRTIMKLSKYDYREMLKYIKESNYEAIRCKYSLSDKIVSAVIDKYSNSISRDNRLIDTLIALGYKRKDVLDNYDKLNALNIEDNILLAARIIGKSYE